MSITIDASPQSITTAYNENYFLIDSTNSSESGFRYIVRIKIGSNTIGTYKVRPRPLDNKGELDIKTILQNQLGEDYDPTLDAFTVMNNQRIDYTLEIDEEYLVSEAFIGYGFGASTINGGTWPNGNNPQFNPNGISRTMLIHLTEPVYEQGDVINVAQDNTVNFRPELEGIHTVLDKYLDGGTWYLVLDLPWIGSGAASPGDAFFADGKKTVFDGITSSSFRIWRGAFAQDIFISYDNSEWVTTDSTSNLITTLPEDVRISRDKDTYLTCYNSTSGTLYVVFNIDGTLYRYSIGSTTDFILFNAIPSDDNIEDILSGGTWSAFGGGLDLSNVKSYTVQILDASNLKRSIEKTINLYSDCDKYDTYDVTFIDRLGSWITIPFNKGSYLNQQVNKQKYRKKYGTFGPAEWGYSLMDRGITTYDIEEEITYTLNTGILSEVESQYMKELVSSPSVYISINGGPSTAIDIITSSINLHKKRTKRDRIISIKFKKSVQDNING